MAFQDDNNFVTVGAKHYKYWTVGGGNLKSRMGNFGKSDQRIGSVAFNKNTCLTGSITGELYLWNGPSLGQAKKLHERLIDAITVTPKFIFTGGRD